jgi:hypothetical protein
MKKSIFILLLLLVAVTQLQSCKKENDNSDKGIVQINKASAGNTTLAKDKTTEEVVTEPTFTIEWSSAIDLAKASVRISLKKETDMSGLGLQITQPDPLKLVINTELQLAYQTTYLLSLAPGSYGKNGEMFAGISYRFTTEAGKLVISSITVNGSDMLNQQIIREVPYDSAFIEVKFNELLNTSDLTSHFTLLPGNNLSVQLGADGKSVVIKPNSPLGYYTKHRLLISAQLQSVNGFTFNGFNGYFITNLDSTDKFPPMSDDALLDLVQLQTFRYFWDYGHPQSGMTRERFGSGETVTTGGSGFGVMTLPIAVERGFITREQAMNRLQMILNFLSTADRFHGAWPHWINGSTGKTIPFSTNDNGADLVETSYMAAGLLTMRQYLDFTVPTENELIAQINTLLSEIEWDWFTRGGQDVLYWHWSPTVGWAMNMQVKGYNEALITYFMAATSETFPVSASVYHNGWASSSYFINGKTFYGHVLPLGFDYGGPLFFAHYSFLGLNPTNLSDQYANYWTQNRNHTLINRQHCITNPFNRTGYSSSVWGLTASDDPNGYAVHEPVPGRDNGTISPTAALSSFPYTPEQSMEALRFFYYKLGDKLWGEYGFYDAFNPHEGWWADSYLAIDQGPIMIMIENHRSSLPWNLFMSAPETQAAMNKLGFSR